MRRFWILAVLLYIVFDLADPAPGAFEFDPDGTVEVHLTSPTRVAVVPTVPSPRLDPTAVVPRPPRREAIQRAAPVGRVVIDWMGLLQQYAASPPPASEDH
jgi:hypothetical protein